MTANRCSACGAAFACGHALGESRCWCAELPRILPLEAESSCLCPACLKAQVRQRIAAFVRTVTPANAAAAATRARRYVTDEDPVEGIDFEIERGLLVFTAWYLLKRGTCCEAGCRQCPYGFEERAS